MSLSAFYIDIFRIRLFLRFCVLQGMNCCTRGSWKGGCKNSLTSRSRSSGKWGTLLKPLVRRSCSNQSFELYECSIQCTHRYFISNDDNLWHQNMTGLITPMTILKQASERIPEKGPRKHPQGDRCRLASAEETSRRRKARRKWRRLCEGEFAISRWATGDILSCQYKLS